MMKARKYVCLIMLVSLLMPHYGHAATCGGGLNPILIATIPISFLTYDAGLNVNLAINGSITVTCTVVAATTLPSFSIALSASSGGGSNINPRRMLRAGFSTPLNYNIYTTDSYATIWGDGGSSTSTQSYNTNDDLSLKIFTAYGVIPKRQFVPAGLYTDSVTVTVTY